MILDSQWILLLLVSAVVVLLLRTKRTAEARLRRQENDARLAMGEYQSVITRLTEETNHYKTLVESANELIFRCDLDGYFTYSNTIALKTWDLNDDELLGKKYLNFVREDYRRKMEKFFFRQFLARELTTYYEYPVVVSTGKEIWLGQNTQLLYDNDKPIGFQAVAREITEVKEIQKQLIDSKEMYRSFISVLQEGIIVHDASGQIISANSSAEKMLGLSVEQMKGLAEFDRVWHTIRQDGSEFPLEHHPAAITLKTGESMSDVIMGVHRLDGTLVWISINSQPLFHNESTTPTGVVVSFIDITNRKLAQQELKQAKANIDAWLDNTLDAVWAIDKEFRLIMCNRYYRITAQLTFTIMPKIGESAFSGMTEPVQKRAEEFYGRALEGESFSVEQGVEIAGSYQYFEIAFNPILSGESVVGVAVLGKNITARKYSEQQLRDTLQLQQAILNGTDYMIIATDIHGVITIVNSAVESKLGYQAQELVGMLTPAIFHEPMEVVRRAERLTQELAESVEVGFETFIAKAKRGTPDENEWTYIRKDGRTFPVLLSVTATKNSEGSIDGFLGIAKDISVQKQAQQEVERRDHLLEGISKALQHLIVADNLDNRIQDIISIIGTSANADGVFLYQILQPGDEAMTATLRFRWVQENDQSTDPRLEHGDFDISSLYQRLAFGAIIIVYKDEYHALGMQEFLSVGIESCMMVPIVMQGRLWGIITLVDIHSKRHWAEWEKSILSSVSVSIAGAVERWEGQQKLHKFAEDIIEAKLFLEEQAQHLELQNEALVTAREEADAANRAKSIFLSSMSHELRTPLNSILGFTQILLKDKALTEQSRNYVSMMYRSGSHLLEMINDVLDISKIESGYMEILSEKFNLYQALNEIEEMFALRCKEKGLTFTMQATSDHFHAVETDAKRLKQVLINLVSNAVKFTQVGGITLSVEILRELDSDATGTVFLLRFAISDTGRGIPEEQLRSIFEPFRQVTGMYSDGTGLGLSISSRIVSMLGGTIAVDSGRGTGTTFLFDIPVRCSLPERVQQQDDGALVVGIKGDTQWKVLIVDDIDTNREVAKALLAPLGFVCEVAENGAEALAQITEFHPDIILMDIVMPIMNGQEATIHIRSKPESAALPVIAVTASGLEGKRDELLKNGFNDYIQKPFMEIELLRIIQKHLGLEYVYEHSGESAVQSVGPQPLQVPEIVEMIQAMPPQFSESMLEAIELQDFDSIAQLLDYHGIMSKEPRIGALFTKAVLHSDYKLLVSIADYLHSTMS